MAVLPKVIWYNQKYLSGARVADDYCRALAEHGVLTDRLSEAQVVVIHNSMDRAVTQSELRKKYCIGYLVFDADRLDAKITKDLSCLDEVWTPSTFNQKTLSEGHACVTRIPHIVDIDPRFNQQDLSFCQQLIDYDPECRYFLTVTALFRPRKNVIQLVQAFNQLVSDLAPCRLIIKDSIGEGSRHDAYLGPNVVHITDHLSEAQLVALYSLCHLYVSAHHAEGWGLPLSDAMFLGKPVLASGYSGNLDFMTPKNSLLIACDEEVIHPVDRGEYYDDTMRWGYPRHADLLAKLRLANEMITDGSIKSRVEQAKADMTQFSSAAVGQMMIDRLRVIGEEIGLGR